MEIQLFPRKMIIIASILMLWKARLSKYMYSILSFTQLFLLILLLICKAKSIPTLEMKLKINADSEAGKWAVSISGVNMEYTPLQYEKLQLIKIKRCCTVLHNEQCVAQLRTKECVLLKMEELLLIWISDQQVKGDNVNSTLIQQNVKKIFNNLKANSRV